ncbi:hypothetical protein L6164_000910 [Bauhinia variegata]|uniref:Uncharacterized protein n=1 Tax=Bauhinia variegata TaxID=167791 RepID=A0ACB9QA28_BAUVA|nr:hypothetical protein L6164_000910 [Bauhinia variegata]
MDLYEFGLWGKKCCIYEVPQSLRKEENLSAYTPQYFSIGPIHHERKDNLKTMKKLKMTYRESFETRLPDGKASMEKYRCYLEQHEQEIRLCYSKKFDEGKNQFLNIIMLDAIFIMELFILTLAFKYFFNPDDKSTIPSYKESKHFTDLLRYTKLATAYDQLEYNQGECFHKLKTAIKLDAAGITIEQQKAKQKI